jgi:hypothetical protein
MCRHLCHILHTSTLSRMVLSPSDKAHLN